MIRRLQRAIATLLLVTLAPATVMAAVTKLCVNGNGQGAIEFVLADEHGVVENVEHKGDVIEQGEPCADFGLLSDLSGSNRPVTIKLRPSPNPPPVEVLLSGCASNGAGRREATPLAAPFKIPSSPQLTELRTVVLRF